VSAQNDARLTARDRKLAALLTVGLTDEAAGAKLGVSRRTVTRTKAKPGFRRLVDGLRDDAADRIVGALGEVAAEAVGTLRALLVAPGAAVQLGAVRTALEFLIRGREHAELARRIGDLERANDDPLPADAAGTGRGDPAGEPAGPGNAGPADAEPGTGAAGGGPVAGGAHPGAAAADAGGV